MAKRQDSSRSGDAARSAILEAAEALLAASDSRTVTVDAIASKAQCAKGLVNYHYRSKDALLTGVVERMAERRTNEWRTALAGADLPAAIARAWQLTLHERSSGRARALSAAIASGSKSTVRSVKVTRESLRQTVAEAGVGLLERCGLEPTIPAAELGDLIACSIEGFAAAAERDQPERLEGAFSALWAAVLSLTRPSARH